MAIKILLSIVFAASLLSAETTFADRAPAAIPSKADLIVPKMVKPEEANIPQAIISKVLPTDMAQSSDSMIVERRLIENGLAHFNELVSETAQQVGLPALKAIDQLIESVRPTIEVGEDADGTHHAIGFEVLSINHARIEYTGALDCGVTYGLADNSIGVSISEKIESLGEGAHIVVNHNVANSAQQSHVLMKWDF